RAASSSCSSALRAKISASMTSCSRSETARGRRGLLGASFVLCLRSLVGPISNAVGVLGGILLIPADPQSRIAKLCQAEYGAKKALPLRQSFPTWAAENEQIAQPIPHLRNVEKLHRDWTVNPQEISLFRFHHRKAFHQFAHL